jgi:putative transposase
MGMSGVSKSQVSRLCDEIDERVNAFLDRPIEGDWPYLWIPALLPRRDPRGTSMIKLPFRAFLLSIGTLFGLNRAR